MELATNTITAASRIGSHNAKISVMAANDVISRDKGQSQLATTGRRSGTVYRRPFVRVESPGHGDVTSYDSTSGLACNFCRLALRINAVAAAAQSDSGAVFARGVIVL